MENKDFSRIFLSHKADFPDEGFSGRVIKQLPERKSMAPQIVMVTFVVIGMALMFGIQGFVPLLEQIDSLVISVSRLQIPSPTAIVAYISVLATTLMIGFSVAHDVSNI